MFPLGASYDGAGVNFALFSQVADKVELCLFDEHDHETRVEMTCSEKGKGKISIPFANEAELERIIEMFDKLRN